MSERTKEMFNLVDSLPESEQDLISEMIRRVVLAWDPDFTKVTSSEKKRMEIAEEELNNGEYYTSEDAWRDLDD